MGIEHVKLQEKFYKDECCDSSLYSFVTEVSEQITCCNVEDLSKKCVYVEQENGHVYIVLLINNIETD